MEVAYVHGQGESFNVTKVSTHFIYCVNTIPILIPPRHSSAPLTYSEVDLKGLPRWRPSRAERPRQSPGAPTLLLKPVSKRMRLASSRQICAIEQKHTHTNTATEGEGQEWRSGWQEEKNVLVFYRKIQNSLQTQMENTKIKFFKYMKLKVTKSYFQMEYQKNNHE